MRTLVPYAPTLPKSRLGALLSGREREAFARAMLDDVLTAIAAAGGTPLVLTTEPVEGLSFDQRVDEAPLSNAVNAALDPPMAVVMADLGIATAESLRRLFAADAELVIAPGRGGGTNAIVVRHADFAVDYHGNSLDDHRQLADTASIARVEIDSFRLACDIDEPDDLVEVLLHSEGGAADWLRDHGIELALTGGRVTVCRPPQ